MTSKKSKSKKTSAKKSTTKKRSTKKTGAKKTRSKKASAKRTGSTKAATSRKTVKPAAGTATATLNPSMPPAELFVPYEGPTPDGTSFKETNVAEPWQETESSLPDLMARSITTSLDAHSETTPEAQALDAFAADLDTDATTAGSPTWAAFKTSAKQPSGFVGRSLAAVWNMLVGLLGAPPPADRK